MPYFLIEIVVPQRKAPRLYRSVRGVVAFHGRFMCMAAEAQARRATLRDEAEARQANLTESTRWCIDESARIRTDRYCR